MYKRIIEEQNTIRMKKPNHKFWEELFTCPTIIQLEETSNFRYIFLEFAYSFTRHQNIANIWQKIFDIFGW